MKKILLLLAALLLLNGCSEAVEFNKDATFADSNLERDSNSAAEKPVIQENTNTPREASEPVPEENIPETNINLIDRDGMTVMTRVLAPEGFIRSEAESDSLLTYLRQMKLKEADAPVLLYDGNEKRNQRAHIAVYDMDLIGQDLQQCADSLIRIYAEYFYQSGMYEKIGFHLTNGFWMDYPAWQQGMRIRVDGNQVQWVAETGYDDSYECFRKYLQQVMNYAGTLSLEQECTGISEDQIQTGDLFINGGSPGHCVMVVDIAENEMGEKCFLLAQGYMPAQEFHILKNPLHEQDPWYYSRELNYPLSTPEYGFAAGSLKRWNGMQEHE